MSTGSERSLNQEGEKMSECIMYSRSQDQLAIANKPEHDYPIYYTEEEALTIFGEELLDEVYWYGAAAFRAVPDEPSNAMKNFRIDRGLSVSELAELAGVDELIVINAEDPTMRNSFRDLMKIAKVLEIDANLLSHKTYEEIKDITKSKEN